VDSLARVAISEFGVRIDYEEVFILFYHKSGGWFEEGAATGIYLSVNKGRHE